jgi:hypothetical protein
MINISKQQLKSKMGRMEEAMKKSNSGLKEEDSSSSATILIERLDGGESFTY